MNKLPHYDQVTLRKKPYAGMEELQKDLDEWLVRYDTGRAIRGKCAVGGRHWKRLRMK